MSTRRFHDGVFTATDHDGIVVIHVGPLTELSSDFPLERVAFFEEFSWDRPACLIEANVAESATIVIDDEKLANQKSRRNAENVPSDHDRGSKKLASYPEHRGRENENSGTSAMSLATGLTDVTNQRRLMRPSLASKVWSCLAQRRSCMSGELNRGGRHRAHSKLNRGASRRTFSRCEGLSEQEFEPRQLGRGDNCKRKRADALCDSATRSPKADKGLRFLVSVWSGDSERHWRQGVMTERGANRQLRLQREDI